MGTGWEWEFQCKTFNTVLIFKINMWMHLIWIYCLLKEKAKFKSETSDCEDEYFYQKQMFILFIFSFQWRREELRNDVLLYCCSFVLGCEPLWQTCHWKGETRQLRYPWSFLLRPPHWFSSSWHLMQVVVKLEVCLHLGCSWWSCEVEGPQRYHPCSFWRIWEN